MAEDFPKLSAEEVYLVRGWYDGLTRNELAAGLGIAPTQINPKIRAMRRRGLAITRRSKGWFHKARVSHG